jgi:basic amino acid/polyamine antiporter, APA family
MSMAETAVMPEQTAERSSGAGKAARLAYQMGLPGVVAFSTASIGLTYSGAFFYSSVVGRWPGADVFGVFTIAVLVGMLFSYLYAVIGVVAPRYGADYVLSSRVLPPSLAFATSWTMVIFFAILAGSTIAGLVKNTFPAFARMYAMITGSTGILTQLAALSSAQGVVTISTVVVVLVFLLLILPPQVTRQVLIGGVVLAIVGWVIVYSQIGLMSSAKFATAWNTLNNTSFSSLLDMARGQGMQADFSAGRSILAGLSLAFLLVFGNFNPAIFPPEVHQPEKNLLRGSWLSLLVVWLVLGVGGLIVQRVLAPEWLSAQSFLSLFGASQEIATPSVTYYAAIASPSAFWLVVVGIIWLFTLFTLAQTLLYTASREMIAWAQDRLVPSIVGYMHPSLRSPLIAVLLAAILAELAVVDTAVNGSLLLRYNLLYFMGFVLIVPIFSVMLLPFRKPGWFDGAPRFVRLKIGPLPVVSLASAVALGYLIWMLATNVLLKKPVGMSTPSLIVLAVLFGSGLILFYIRLYYLRTVTKEQIDTRLSIFPEE